MRERRVLVMALLAALLLGGCAPGAAAPTAGPTAVPSPAPLVLAEGQEAIVDVGLEGALDLTGAWRCRAVPAVSDELAAAGYDDSGWDEVQAPAPWAEQGLGELTGQAKVVLYRRVVEVPAAWQGQAIGISAWFNSHDSLVFVNGERVEPLRRPFAPYGDVSELLRYGEANTIAVTSLYDGAFEMAEAGLARLGPIAQRAVTKVLLEDVTIDTPGGAGDATLVRPAAGTGLPALAIVATGSHGMGEKSEWLEFAADLARQGYVVLPVALKVQEVEGVRAAVAWLRAHAAVDPARIALLGADRGARPVLEAALQDGEIRGVALVSGATLDDVTALGGRPLLLLAAEGDRRGQVLKEAQDMAVAAGGSCRVVGLPGDGHGSFVLTSAWNATRRAILSWLQESVGAP